MKSFLLSTARDSTQAGFMADKDRWGAQQSLPELYETGRRRINNERQNLIA
jgi:hypothetical protein